MASRSWQWMGRKVAEAGAVCEIGGAGEKEGLGCDDWRDPWGILCSRKNRCAIRVIRCRVRKNHPVGNLACTLLWSVRRLVPLGMGTECHGGPRCQKAVPSTALQTARFVGRIRLQNLKDAPFHEPDSHHRGTEAQRNKTDRS